MGKAIVKRKKGISPIWLLPLVAALIGVWLIYKGIVEAPIKVVINFETAGGITAGKTKVLYKGLKTGVVRSVQINPDLKSVDVAVDVDRSAEGLLGSETEFWLVKPQVSLEGISGLGTLVAGDYIAMRPADGRGRPTRKFKALAAPPPIAENAPGLHLILYTKDLASVQVGSPVYYKRIAVGDVQSYKLVEDEQQIAIRIYIHPQYSQLVNEHTRFWNASGISVHAGLFSGAQINLESLQSLLAGGIAFYTPEHESKSQPAGQGETFTLFTDLQSAQQVEKADKPGLKVILRADALGSITKKNNVFYREIVVGKVSGYELAATADHVLIYVDIEHRYAPLVRKNSVFWNASGIDVHFGLFSGAEIHTESLKSILAGGIAFATPDEDHMGQGAQQNATFTLYPKVKDEWLKWTPKIRLAPASQIQTNAARQP